MIEGPVALRRAIEEAIKVLVPLEPCSPSGSRQATQ
jgi:hypothetical protein